VKRQRDVGFGIVNIYPAPSYTFSGGVSVNAQQLLEDIRHASLVFRSKQIQLRNVAVPIETQSLPTSQSLEEFA
jgi:hypothetical protein